MRKVLLGIVIALVIVFGLRYCEYKKDDRDQLRENSSLIQKQLKNVGKLIVTEGNYAQVLTFSDTEKLFGFLDAKKKAIVVVNATATLSYDLSLITSEISEENKTVTITHIPEPELTINPNIEYYDVTQDYLNQFEASDYNKIKQRVEASLRKKIEASDLQKNAQNRLISELQKIYILTSSMGWTLIYEGNLISDNEDFQFFRD